MSYKAYEGQLDLDYTLKPSLKIITTSMSSLSSHNVRALAYRDMAPLPWLRGVSVSLRVFLVLIDVRISEDALVLDQGQPLSRGV
jgi:hypothetical protein